MHRPPGLPANTPHGDPPAPHPLAHPDPCWAQHPALPEKPPGTLVPPGQPHDPAQLTGGEAEAGMPDSLRGETKAGLEPPGPASKPFQLPGCQSTQADRAGASGAQVPASLGRHACQPPSPDPRLALGPVLRGLTPGAPRRPLAPPARPRRPTPPYAPARGPSAGRPPPCPGRRAAWAPGPGPRCWRRSRGVPPGASERACSARLAASRPGSGAPGPAG